ncbi:MAG TPA: DUF6600 domain-containing protein [Chthoniobacterales bacterium]|nr:DUF6600 domain-containing protein [Chthoniobacterales bacterium]
MKRLLLAVAILTLAFPAIHPADARTDVSIDFFYDNLSEGGNWIEVGDYGYCWQPSVAASNTSWRPYSDGYWAYTDLGWTWISYEDFGWATYHYGRWIQLRGRGWVWVPGREWGPAWVSWRTGGDYIGWAPLPPRRAGEYWDEQPITARVDIEFDIGPAYYNFIDVRYIGEPVLRERIFAADQNATYVTKTVNVTNITYNKAAVYNYGPDFNTVSRYSTRPIQRLTVQRENDLDHARQSKALMKVEGNKLVVAAPQELQKPNKQAAPKVVKEKLTQAAVERGWEPVRDPKAQAELKEKIKKEDPKSIPPPTVQASEKTAPNASVQPTTNATVAPSIAPKAPKEKNEKRKFETVVPPAPVAPKVAPPVTPDIKPNRPAPDLKPEAAVDKSKHEPSADMGQKQTKDKPATAPTP